MNIKSSKIKTEMIIRKIRIKGLTEIMFDRYAGDNNTKLEPYQKLYLDPMDGETICMPSLNIVSFLSAHNTNSAPKRLRDKRRYKDIANSMLSFITISPSMIPFLREGNPIKLGKIENDVDSKSGIYVHRSVARLDKGIPNPKERPVLSLPWNLEFDLSIFPNKEIREEEIQNLFVEGGLAIGLGTFRGVFGKFVIDKWE